MIIRFNGNYIGKEVPNKNRHKALKNPRNLHNFRKPPLVEMTIKLPFRNL